MSTTANAIYDVMRQFHLFCKDLAGVPLTAADLPTQFISDLRSPIADYLSKLSLSSLPQEAASDPAVLTALQDIKASTRLREGLTITAVSGNQLGKNAASAQTIDPSANVFSSPETNFTLFSLVPVNSLRLNRAQKQQIDSLVRFTRLTTVDDLKNSRAAISDLAYRLANNFGAVDTYYADIYGKPTPTPRSQEMNLDEYDLLKQLYDVIQSIDILTATNQIDKLARQAAQSQNNSMTGNTAAPTVSISGSPNMDYVAGLAVQSGIPFEIAQSKILAPVPFGLNIEQIAARYLGDPQRWLEIVTLNGLSDPYIDENGFQLPLLSNAGGRQITVSSDENLYEGQRIVITSAPVGPSARVILGIDKLSDTSFLLTLDGDPNLDVYTLADMAYVQAYLPGTVNSQQKIFIPSNLPTASDVGITPPASTSGDPLTGLSKVDLLLTDTGDLAINNYGDFRYASGLTNIIQALKIKIGTAQGSSLLHPTFGLGVKPGTINSEVQVQDLFNSLNTMIQEDDRFQGINSLQISLSGPTLSISMGVNMANQNGVLPLSFSLTG